MLAYYLHAAGNSFKNLHTHICTPHLLLQVGVTKFGAYTSHIQLDTSYLRHFREAWSYKQAAAFPVQALTALYGLQSLGAIRSGSCLLIHSAAGGVGLAALKIARHFGCSVLGTVGSADKLQTLDEQFGRCWPYFACLYCSVKTLSRHVHCVGQV